MATPLTVAFCKTYVAVAGALTPLGSGLEPQEYPLGTVKKLRPDDVLTSLKPSDNVVDQLGEM